MDHLDADGEVTQGAGGEREGLAQQHGEPGPRPLAAGLDQVAGCVDQGFGSRVVDVGVDPHHLVEALLDLEEECPPLRRVHGRGWGRRTRVLASNRAPIHTDLLAGPPPRRPGHRFSWFMTS